MRERFLFAVWAKSLLRGRRAAGILPERGVCSSAVCEEGSWANVEQIWGANQHLPLGFKYKFLVASGVLLIKLG